MKILVTGKGGREHALVKKINEQGEHRVFVFPGNAGILQDAELLKPEENESLAAAAVREGIELVVVGEEKYLAEGLSDECRQKDLPVWGPSKTAAQLETSKLFAKEFMRRHGVPTGSFAVASSPEEINDAVSRFPVVLKFDGLAAGKGVSVCFDRDDVDSYRDRVYNRKLFGEGVTVVEEYLEGREISIICAVSGENYVIFPAARDYKRAFDGDNGPNTGGMGAVASLELVPGSLLEEIRYSIIQPTIRGLKTDGLDYRGFLYFGIILTSAGPKVLEYNCRFGDPEAQAVLGLVDGDFVRLLQTGAAGKMDMKSIRFTGDWSVCLVIASRDYPETGSDGEIISGLDILEGVNVFHSGTRTNEYGEFVVSGGRILSLSARAQLRQAAVAEVYEEVEKVCFAGKRYRKDIGRLHFDDAVLSSPA